MTTPISIDIAPANDTTDLAYDLLKQFVAVITKDGSTPNFIDGWNGEDALVDDTIILYPGFLEDGPDDAGLVQASEGEALGSEPFRRASAKVLFRCKNDDDNSGRKKANAAAHAVELFLRPLPGYERTLDTLPSGRRVLAYENVRRIPAGRDSSQRDQVIVEFDLRIQEAGTP